MGRFEPLREGQLLRSAINVAIWRCFLILIDKTSGNIPPGPAVQGVSGDQSIYHRAWRDRAMSRRSRRISGPDVHAPAGVGPFADIGSTPACGGMGRQTRGRLQQSVPYRGEDRDLQRQALSELPRSRRAFTPRPLDRPRRAIGYASTSLASTNHRLTSLRAGRLRAARILASGK